MDIYLRRPTRTVWRSVHLSPFHLVHRDGMRNTRRRPRIG